MKTSVEVFLSLGSNMGNRLKYLTDATDIIEKRIGLVTKKSSVYESEPWGNKNQNAFYNQIISIHTSLDAKILLKTILNIEVELGRKRTEHWGPREIDVDILFYNSQIINDKDLVVPHPEIANRMFVLMPMTELAPDFIHPIIKKSIRDLMRTCSDRSNVIAFKS
jgi:2-amino-4-hydroxy-6-hydroxymethyldihydropteridine diphosphokinase